MIFLKIVFFLFLFIITLLPLIAAEVEPPEEQLMLNAANQTVFYQEQKYSTENHPNSGCVLILDKHVPSLDEILWAVACDLSLEHKQSYDFRFWHERYFPAKYTYLDSSVLQRSAAAATLAIYHIWAQGNPLMIQFESGMDATHFKELEAEVEALMYREGGLREKFMSLCSAESKLMKSLAIGRFPNATPPKLPSPKVCVCIAVTTTAAIAISLAVLLTSNNHK